MEFETYYNEVYSEHQLGADLSRKDRLEFLFQPVPQGYRILSIGCGPGVDVEFLVRAGNEVHGIDISREALSQAQARGLIPHEIDLTHNKQLPFDESTFDVIIATDILEHIFLPQHLLEKIATLLKPNGYLITSVPNHFTWRMRWRILKGKDLILPAHKQARQWNYFHIRFFTSEGVEEMLAEAGFRILEHHYSRFISIPGIFPLSLGRKLATKYPDLFSKHFIVKATRS